ncbi:DNA translocase FtsK [Elusimicrobiota bacterium]
MRNKNRTSRVQKKRLNKFLSVFLIFTSAVIALILIIPRSFGLAGFGLKHWLIGALGWPVFIFPAVLVYCAINLIRSLKSNISPVSLAYSAGIIPFGGFFALYLLWGNMFFSQGDVVGSAATGFIRHMRLGMGAFGSFALSLALALVWMHFAFGIRWLELAVKAYGMIREEWLEWVKQMQARSKQAALDRSVVEAKNTPAVTVIKRVEPIVVQDDRKEDVNAELEARRSAVAKMIKESSQGGSEAQSGPIKSKRDAKNGSSRKWQLPSRELLAVNKDSSNKDGASREESVALGRGRDLVNALNNFNVKVELAGVVPGPVVTRYDLVPHPGVKTSEISTLANDIALALKVAAVRVLGPIAGKGVIGLEVPNLEPRLVCLREIIESNEFNTHKRPKLPMAFGRAADGTPVVADLTEMPHILVAGATNSGKSVLIHSMISSLLYKKTPDELRFVMIDPKRLELSFYGTIGHLFNPRDINGDPRVIVDPRDASLALLAMLRIMEARYEKFAKLGARNIEAYNDSAVSNGEQPEPYLVVIIDELADLMLIAGREVEATIQRLAQMARAVGIHLILSTQRPSVDVITGVIKGNLPARVALQVVSKIDSRVILDSQGAEYLLGSGDMLYLASGAPRPVRLQGCFVSDDEISAVTKFWAQQGKPERGLADMLGVSLSDSAALNKFADKGDDPLAKALVLIKERKRVSQDLLKANFGSSARATDILSRLEVGGFIFKPEGTNRWEIRYDKLEDYLTKK